MPSEVKTSQSRADESVTVATFNTIVLSAGNVYNLTPGFCGPYFYDILNLGPCTVYIRADADPSPGDPASETLPPGFADNLVLVDGVTGLRFLAACPCVAGPGLGPPPCASGATGCVATITVRMVRG